MAGCRTPFARAGTVYRDLTAVDLGVVAVRELLARAELPPASVEQVVMGQVLPSIKAFNLAREVTLRTALPRHVPAHTVNRACASAGEAIAALASEILLGHVEVGIAGGAESLSDLPILHSTRMARTLVELQKARSLRARLALLAKLRPRDLVPQAPAIAEPSTGLTMGQSAEKMAKENGITRQEQDEIALASHCNAARATEDGTLASEVCSVLVPPRYETVVTTDNTIRRDTSREALAALPPVFDRRHGTVTAGNSSPLTDGAAAVLLMSEERAKAEGRERIAYIRAWAASAVDPGGQLLMGPALAVPKVLQRAGLTLADMERVEMHEAFAAQVASNVQALESASWALEKLGRSSPVGRVDRERLNVNGGSIAVGHPFGATGARIAATLAYEMKRRNLALGLLSICAQGGMGFAMVLERRD